MHMSQQSPHLEVVGKMALSGSELSHGLVLPRLSLTQGEGPEPAPPPELGRERGSRILCKSKALSAIWAQPFHHPPAFADKTRRFGFTPKRNKTWFLFFTKVSPSGQHSSLKGRWVWASQPWVWDRPVPTSPDKTADPCQTFNGFLKILLQERPCFL